MTLLFGSRLLVCGAALAALGCGATEDRPIGQTSQAIVGGTAAKVGDFPTVVAVAVGSSFCTGVLVAPKVVLTAAHCILPATVGLADQAAVTADTTVFVDTIDVLSGTQYPAADTLPNPAYDSSTNAHDVGFVILQNAVTGHTSSPIKTTTGGTSIGTNVTLVGYGVYGMNGSQPNPAQSGKEFAVDRTTADCDTVATGLTTNAASLCIDQTDKKGTCVGDAGGPAFAMISGIRTVVGIQSFGDQNCNQFSIDVRVDSELDFIGTTLCAADGACVSECGTGALKKDPDCKAADAGSGTGGAPATDGGTGGNTSTGGRGGATSTGGSGGRLGSDSGAPTGGGGGQSGGGTGGVSSAGATGAGGAKSTGGQSSTAGTANGGAPSGADAGPTAAASSDSGCGCRVGQTPRHDTSWFGWALAGVLALRARRRRGRS